MILELLLDNKARFVELIRINDFDNIENCLKIINNFFEEYECPYYTEVKEEKKYKYIYLSEDGRAFFLQKLKDFNKDLQTEQDWGITHSILMN